jgi:hypothetical protein
MSPVEIPEGRYRHESHVLSSLSDEDLRAFAAFIAQKRTPTCGITHSTRKLNADGNSTLKIQQLQTKYSCRVSLTITSDDANYMAQCYGDVIFFFWDIVRANGCQILLSSMDVSAVLATFEDHGVVIYGINNPQKPLESVIHIEIADWYPGERPDNLMRCIRRTTGKVEDRAKNEGERWWVHRNNTRIQDMVLAFCMAFHERLGVDSAVSILSQDIFRTIGTEVVWGVMGYTDILHVLNHR